MREHTINELIERFSLVPHPEGGHFSEVFRSASGVQPHDDRPARSALTAIYFLLQPGEYSCFHRVQSDEVWHHLAGGQLELKLISPDLSEIRELSLHPALEGDAIQVVPAGWWQAAIPPSEFCLASCSVGPGFEFQDFEMARDTPEAPELRRLYPHWLKWI